MSLKSVLEMKSLANSLELVLGKNTETISSDILDANGLID